MGRLILRRILRPPPEPAPPPLESTRGFVAGLVSASPQRSGRGTQRVYRFPNNYGASVITDPGIALGISEETGSDFELAVLVWRGDDYLLSYDTPITNDTIRGLSDAEVEHYLQLIRQLPNAD